MSIISNCESKYANRLRKSTIMYQSTFDNNRNLRVSTDKATEISVYNNRIYGINTINIETKLKKNIDMVYYYNKAMKITRKKYKSGYIKLNVAKTIYLSYKYTNDHFDIIINDNTRCKEKVFDVMYGKVEEHITGLKKMLPLMILVSKEKLYKNVLKQLYKFCSKYEDYIANKNKYVKNALHEIEVKNNIPNDIIKYEIMQYLGM